MTKKADVLIIGGGSIGLNCAYYLLKSGRSVTIVDQKQIAAGSSAGNAGHIVPSHIVPLAAPGMIGTLAQVDAQPGHQSLQHEAQPGSGLHFLAAAVAWHAAPPT